MPYNDPRRLQAVQRFLQLDINRKAEMQEMVELAASLCDTPVAMITLLDERTEYIRFRRGIEIQELLREDTFSQYLIEEDNLLIIPDALQDPRFAHNKMVLSEPRIRFYAGCSLITHDGYSVGSLCIMGQVSKELAEPQRHLLGMMAKRIVEIMEMEFSLSIVKNQFVKAKDSDYKLQAFLESTGTIHMVIGKEMEVIAFNQNAADFIGKNNKVLMYVGITMAQILDEEHLEDFVVEYQKTMAGDPVFYEREVKHENDSTWWSVALEPGYNADGEIIGIYYNATNITEKKVHEKEMMDKNERLMKIAHIQSHELRKPVASILGLMELFKHCDYTAGREELMVLERATNELDTRIRAIVFLTE
ncbi:GAF domain-containing protein [Pedobacter hartonius]|uniref:PAS domain S-box-containing protein n=1 Tax=Pedobacter hartonius TaxID=425514 RepID=A0A1H4HBD4_9SPHI|nr:GAF domain-containing protein [Pedobacter hartonius]SEB18368.1 PAS domain S-box-containing protein [Pedobacter hartonius]